MKGNKNHEKQINKETAPSPLRPLRRAHPSRFLHKRVAYALGVSVCPPVRLPSVLST